MKKIWKAFISIALVTVMMFSVTACGGLSGSYIAEKNGMSVEMVFDNGELTMKMDSLELHGTYSVDGDKITMTMSMFGQDSSNTVDFRQEGNSIWIEGVEYKKK